MTITHTDQPIKEVLTPEEAQFIREQLKGEAGNGKDRAWSSIMRPLYQSSFGRCKKLGGTALCPEHDDLRAMLAELD